MSYLIIEDTLRGHPKLSRFSRTMNVPKYAARGLLDGLWEWAQKYAPDGDLFDFSAEEIAIGAEWDGDAEQFVAALVACGFLERHADGLRIHDFDQYSGRAPQTRTKGAERQARWRDKQRNGGVTPVTLPSNDPTVTPVTSPYKPIQTKPNQAEATRVTAREPAAAAEPEPKNDPNDPLTALPTFQRDFASTALLRFQASRLDADPTVRREIAELAEDYVPTADDLPAALALLRDARKRLGASLPYASKLRELFGPPPGMDALAATGPPGFSGFAPPPDGPVVLGANRERNGPRPMPPRPVTALRSPA